ncbi:MAG: hypothetical protein MI753_11605 [Hyphomicrobiales bacterium]|nr:hypothetical protein [Hyphomicrobiales bacterium]
MIRTTFAALGIIALTAVNAQAFEQYVAAESDTGASISSQAKSGDIKVRTFSSGNNDRDVFTPEQ